MKELEGGEGEIKGGDIEIEGGEVKIEPKLRVVKEFEGGEGI